ncbi:hypothetical protein O6H91_10G045800 [Diphasiastrum complanatum]|uniref:Uncharacterized protein n=1 Tax=Diphasiastrum complanatum TaxID=34168 RepID=A0ACC2CHF1_DIPCM|nr:hypothetical protein O6H91_Y075500 [Diphasiastrum complanatum]KAJ7541097.1 hypothetical protein O6H91_10G045800 [Diphasiastrum complanatum]
MCTRERKPRPAPIRSDTFRKLQPLPLPLPLPPSSQQQLAGSRLSGFDSSIVQDATNRLARCGLGLKLPPLPTESKGVFLEDLQREEIIGRGSSGKVYKTIHRKTGTAYALKVIQEHHEPLVRKQTMKEMGISRHCADSPFVVQCHGVFERGGEIFLILEYMNGGTLADLLNKHGRLTEPVLAHITRQILKGLQYLHSKKIVHRDIKPSNLLLNHKQEVKIADFGVSTELANTLAQCNSFVGTCAYFSPERFDPDVNGGKYDSSADIWSLGLTVLECAIGFFPCLKPGQKPDWPTLICNICLDDPPAPPTDASVEFQGFIRACLQKDPLRRPSAHKLLMHPFLQKYQNRPTIPI